MPESAVLAAAARPADAPAASPAGRRRRRAGWLRQPPVLLGLALVLAILAAAIAAPVLPLRDPNATAPARRLAPPLSAGYVLGSDQLGRDLLSRLVWGARVSISVALVASAVALVGGSAVGLMAGFYGGGVDTAAMRFIDVLMAFPYVLLAIALVAALGPGLLNAMIAIAVVNCSFYARGVRAATLVVRRAPFLEAARAAGASDPRLLRREVIPNIAAPLLVFASLNVGWMIVETAGLSFIGLGAQPPTADWGTMLADGRQFMTVAPHVAVIPGLGMLALVVGFNLVGDGLRDLLDPAVSRVVR
jgi:peptide/nickel transport system permease protein